jgi:hypothetical protein
MYHGRPVASMLIRSGWLGSGGVIWMAMEDGLDLAGIFCSGVVLRREHKLRAILVEVPATPVTAAAFDDHHQAASLARILLLSVLECVSLPAHTV